MNRQETIFYSRAEPTKRTENMKAMSQEEDNYIRMSLLLTGISPRAIRCIFDREFAPLMLDASLKKEYNKLNELKKRKAITISQWNMLFPRFPDVPNSKSFDVTLMVTLLRNLTPMIPPINGYDCLPLILETSEASDLARIKYYRNYLAHLDCTEIETQFFNTAWEQISQAVYRLGGQLMKDECDKLSIKNLDIDSEQLKYEKLKSNLEIENLKIQLGLVHVQIQDIKDNQQNWQFHIPRYVRTQFASETSVKVEWEPPAQANTHCQGYKIFWKEKDSKDSEQFKEVSKDDNSVIVDGLMELTNYWVWVSAVSQENEETLHHSPQIIFKTQKGVPTRPPQNITCTSNHTGTSIDVCWEPPPEEQSENITGYNVYIQKQSDTNGEKVEIKSSTGCRTLLTDLIPATKYGIWISALSNNGYGPPSEQIIIETEVSSSGDIIIFKDVDKIDFGTATVTFNMQGIMSQNMAPIQTNKSSQKFELKQIEPLLLNTSNANLPIGHLGDVKEEVQESKTK